MLQRLVAKKQGLAADVADAFDKVSRKADNIFAFVTNVTRV